MPKAVIHACENCQHFLGLDDTSHADGECRRNSPVPCIGDLVIQERPLVTIWPRVLAGDYCGQFEDRA